MKQFKKLMVFMLAALMVFGTIKYTPIYAEDAVAKEEGVFDTVTFEGKKDITIHAGKPFTFTQKIKKENEINTGEEEIIPETENASQEKKKPIVTVKATQEGDSAKYRAIVSEVKTPEGGNFVYHEGDTTFMPAEAEVGKEYVITYQAETSIDDGKTWQEVPDAKYEVHVKIAEKEEQATESEEQLTPEESEDEHNQENLQITADDIVFHGENEKTISIGTNYNFYDMNNIYASGPSDHHELYAITVEEVETPEGGSYVYQNGDQQFTPTKDDSNLDYTITYGVSVSTDDGTTWHKVDNAEFVTKLHIAKAETTRSARRRRSVPIYAGMISELNMNLKDEYYTGQAVSAVITMAINGTSTVDEPFIVEISLPKDGIYGPNSTDTRYRLQISDFNQSLDSQLSEDSNNYKMTYKLEAGSVAKVFGIPLNFKFDRSGNVPDGTNYTVSLKIKDLNGNVVKEVNKTTRLKIKYPIGVALARDGYYEFKPGSRQFNADNTALTTDLANVPGLTLGPIVQFNQDAIDSQGDLIGIRSVSRIIDTYTLPSIAVVDTSKLPSGAVYNPATHTITRTIENATTWKDGAGKYNIYYGRDVIGAGDLVSLQLPGAILGQIYNFTLKREFQFDNDPAANFSLNSSSSIVYRAQPYYYRYHIETSRKQTGTYVHNPFYVDNYVGWNSKPYVQMSAIRLLSTDDPNPVANLNVEPAAGLTIYNEEIDKNLLYDSVVINPDADSRPTTFSGTLRIVGVKDDGTETVIADNVTYNVGTSNTYPITDTFKTVKVIANAGSSFQTILKPSNQNYSAPIALAQQGFEVKYVFKFKNNLDNNLPYVFINRLNYTAPTNSTDAFESYDYARGFGGSYTPGYGQVYNTIYDYAFFYRPTSDSINDIRAVSQGVSSQSGSGNQYKSLVGDVFTFGTTFKKFNSANDTTMNGGILKVTIPIGFELATGGETLTLGTNGYFEKNATEILNSRRGPFYDYYGRAYYLYDFGKVSGQNPEDILGTFSATITHSSYNQDIPDVDTPRFAEMSLKFDSQSTIVVEERTPRNTLNDQNISERFKYLFTGQSWWYTGLHYVIESVKRTTTFSPSANHSDGFRFSDANNSLTTSSKRLLAFSGADYINNIIDLEVKISSSALREETYQTAALNLNLPEGMEIVPGSETLTDDTGTFHSDKSLSQIIAGRENDKYNLGHASMGRGQNWNLTLRLKVKITDKMFAGRTSFEPLVTLKTQNGITFRSAETIEPNRGTSGSARVFNYIPSNGVFTKLTGYNTTSQSIFKNSKYAEYELTVGNYTGSQIDDVTIIDFLPRVGDIDSKGNPRNSELSPTLQYISAPNATIYVSFDEPREGMTVAEYNSIANWQSYYGTLSTADYKNIKAIKIVKPSLAAGSLEQVATFRMELPDDQLNSENIGKVANNSFSTQFKLNALLSNFAESNVKQFVRRGLNIKTNAFIDVNKNGINDAGDLPLLTNIYADVFKDGIKLTSSTETVWNNGRTSTLSYDEEGNYKIKLSSPGYTYYVYAPYGPGDNQSNIHPQTFASDEYYLSYDGTKEITINIGVQRNDSNYRVKYDLNGAKFKIVAPGREETSFTQIYAIGENMRTSGVSLSEVTYPYHTSSFVWNTEPDGTGVTYTQNQLITGGLSTVPDSVTTLYLQWEKVPKYIVRYHPNGPTSIITGTMADDEVMVDAGYTVRNNGFTNTHATFAGWTTEDGTSFYEGQYVRNLWDGSLYNPAVGYLTPPVVINLYANWKQELYTFKSTNKYGSWSNTVDNPDHPLTDPNDAHPNNFAALDPVAGAIFRINKINDDGTEGEMVARATSGAQGQLYFSNVSAGKYYLTEEYTPDGYVKPEGKWKITVTIDRFTGDLVIETGYSPDPNAKTDPSMLDLVQYPYFMKSMNASIQNEQIFYHNLSLSTRISDESLEYSSVNQNYRYKLTFLDRIFRPIKNATYNFDGETITGVANGHPAPANGTITTDENGVAYVTLKHGQRINIKNLLSNTRVSIIQLTEGGDIYTQKDNGGFYFNPDRVIAAKILGENGSDIAVDYKIMNFSPVPTGIHHMNNKSILLGVGAIVFLMLVAYSVYIRKRRYHRMNLSEDRNIYASRMVPKGVKVDAYQEDQTEIKPPVGGPSPGIRNPHHRSRDSTDLQLPIWMVSDTG